MKTIILFISLLFSFSSFAQIEGTWNGNIEIPSNELPFVVHITKEGNELKATFDSPDQGAFDIEMPEIRFENNTLHLADRKSTRLNSSHVRISYAVFCLKKK